MNWHISDHFFSILFNSIASLSLRYKTLFRLKGQTHLHFRFDNSSNLFICCFGGKRLASRSFLSVLAPFFFMAKQFDFWIFILALFSCTLVCGIGMRWERWFCLHFNLPFIFSSLRVSWYLIAPEIRKWKRKWGISKASPLASRIKVYSPLRYHQCHYEQKIQKRQKIKKN